VARPKTGRMKVFQTRFPEDLLAAAEEVASWEGRPVANLIRRALSVYVANARLRRAVQQPEPDNFDDLLPPFGHGHRDVAAEPKTEGAKGSEES
jgi:hypothetical protein